MDIKLKKIVYSLPLSQETYCFRADVYCDNVLIGYADNDGRGGNTFVYPYEGNMKKITEIEKYFKALPSETYKYDDGTTFSIKNTLDSHIDTLIDEYINKKERDKQLKRHMTKGIVFSNSEYDDNFEIITWKYKLKDMLKTPMGKTKVAIELNKFKKENKFIHNTNIPKDVYDYIKL